MIKHIRNPFIISFAFLIFSITFLTIFFNKISRDSLVEQVQHRQQAAVRAGAKSIESFLNSIGRTTAIIADTPTQDKLDEFVEVWGDDNVVGIIAVNKNGNVVAASNRENKSEIGETVVERGYFAWAKTAKKGEYRVFSPVVSKIGASKGQFIITVASPVVKDDTFNGVVVTAILVSDLTKAYLSNMKVLESSKLYIITDYGKVIYSEQPEFLSLNFSDIFKNDFLGRDKVLEIINNELKKKDETKIQLAIPNFDNGFKIEPYLISAAPISLSNNLWKIIISVPEDDLFVFTYSVFNKQIVAIFVVVTLFILLTLRVSRNIGYDQAVVDEHKKHGIS